MCIILLYNNEYVILPLYITNAGDLNEFSKHCINWYAEFGEEHYWQTPIERVEYAVH